MSVTRTRAEVVLPWQFNQVQLLDVLDPQTIKVQLDLGFGIKLERDLRLARYHAPTYSNVAGPRAGQLSMAAMVRMGEVLREIQDNDLTLQVLTHRDIATLGDFTADLKIQQVNGDWIDLVDILLEEGWGTMKATRFNVDDPYPIPVDDPRRD